ncbi:hypothetical protein AB0F81_36735 [Actinoplanes sp. NPDC024001]|uniref:hypothetical protein n=1 Tax=Actinoplanes sp. NPDC024001 TaxID=3154598 RepID=UPI0033C5FCC7
MGSAQAASPAQAASSAAEFDPWREAAPLPPLDELVAAVNTAGFAPGDADAAAADRAAAQVLAFTSTLRRRRPWWARIWWNIRPGPLRWHRAR